VAISRWANEGRRVAYEQAYHASLELWPVPFERREIDSAFGRTHVVEWGTAGGRPLVLLHAASLSATQWYLQAASLGADHRMVALDILGDIGLSTAARPLRTRQDAAAWLAEALDALGLRRPVLVGSSLGGFHATNLAVLRPERVDALVLLAPAATVQPFRTLARATIRLGSLAPLPFTVRPGLRSMMRGLPDERIVRQMELGVAGFRYDRRNLFPTELGDAELSAITCPVLLLVGDQEMIYDPCKAVARAQATIPGIEAEVLPGVGHLLGLQRPGEVDERILAFLAAAGAA
jgi:pimeloyl-ACP methyl ester carboxylesterase